MAVMKNIIKKSAGRASSVDPARQGDSDTRKQRTDGAEARARLIDVALHLFVEKGFSRTSTRDIASEAGVNLAAIKYYFGDKAGLYRAVFTEPLSEHCGMQLPIDEEGLTLRQSIERFFEGFFEPLKQTDLIQLCIRLHFREMIEPTGLWIEEIDNNIKPAHEALVVALMRYMQVSRADDEIHRLAFSIAGLAIQMFTSHDVINAIRPSLIGSEKELDRWSERMADYAEAMAAAEKKRRNAADKNKKSDKKSEKKNV
jgi:TetR/AcrR family transcriptional regulator, regulator of cefoperazone and chloramphenicol sensitivity